MIRSSNFGWQGTTYLRPKLPRPDERLLPADLPLETEPRLREMEPPRLREGELRKLPPERELGAVLTDRPPKLPEDLERETEPRKPPNERDRPMRGALREDPVRDGPDARGMDRPPDRSDPEDRELVRGTNVPRLPLEWERPILELPDLTPLDREIRERLLGMNVDRPPEDLPSGARMPLVRGMREFV